MKYKQNMLDLLEEIKDRMDEILNYALYNIERMTED